MKSFTFNIGKIALLLCNFIFLLSGICLVLLGCVLANDTPRILLSRLALEPGLTSQPLLYYVALGFITAGLLVCAVAVLGCWASWVPKSGCLMAMYMFLLVIMLLSETSFGVVASLCPQMIGVDMDRDGMVTSLMNNYGVPGRDQYTLAVDLAQTLFECCGMQSGSDYDGSMWWRREQETQHDLRVPWSCCFLNNTDDENAFLDPQPLNATLCQAKNNARYQYGRHVKGCTDRLNDWFKEHTTIFLIVGLALIVVQLSVLLCAIFVCIKRGKTTEPPHEYPETPPQNQVSVSTISKQRFHSDNDFTPKPDEKNMNFYGGALEENGFPINRNFQNHIDFHMNTKPMNYSSKKLNFLRNEEQYGMKRNESPLAIPLVLRNDHFQSYDDNTNKQNTDSTMRRKLSRISEGDGHFQDVYFSPKFKPYRRKEEPSSYNNKDTRRDRDASSYFAKGDDFYNVNYNKYDSRQGT